MLLRYRPYYEAFRCIASACPVSCCHEWDVLVDNEAAARYHDLPGELGDDLRKYLYVEDGQWYFSITDGRCPMWRRDGLCRIQAQLGHDALCATCREFPRIHHEYGDFTELQLELSCPEAAKFILSAADDAWIEREVTGGEAPEYDEADMALLLRTREKMLKILSDRQFSVREALALGLLYAYRTQDELDGAEEVPFDPEAELSFARSIAKEGDMAGLVQFYAGLNILTERWRARLAAAQGDGTWDHRLRALARYGVERYWLQAISDFDLVGRAKMVIASCLLVRHLGGELLPTAQLYAKEIENDADNICAILDGAYTYPALTDDKLLGILLL